MMFRRRIAAVSYLNTIPFIYGMERADNMRAGLLLSPPSGCAKVFSQGQADIALVPVGALPGIENARIITPYCIGASGSVRTVVVTSDSPVEDIKRVWLDSHSMTSALLTKILCAELWEISPEFLTLDDYTVADNPAEGDAFLFIGDKVFDYERRFRYTWDLADCWRELTGLPFVFAVWIASESVTDGEVMELQKALGEGIVHVREAIGFYGHSGKPYAYNYLTRNIDYRFDELKQQALSLYLEKGRKFLHKTDPG